MAVMGHSMGGGGALLAANQRGESDRIAEVAEHAWRHFESIPASTPKVYMDIAGSDHFVPDTNRGDDLATVGRYALAWLKLHLDGEQRYWDLLFGARPESDVEKFSCRVSDA
jgi:S-formylglutathione hydrolase FrmB